MKRHINFLERFVIIIITIIIIVIIVVFIIIIIIFELTHSKTIVENIVESSQSQ